MSKTKCEYCGGVTHDDDAGNCFACGAPRNVENVYEAITREAVARYPVVPHQFRYGFGLSCSTSGEDITWIAST